MGQRREKHLHALGREQCTHLLDAMRIRAIAVADQ